MEFDDNEEYEAQKSHSNKPDVITRPSGKAKKSVEQARQSNKANMIGNRRFGPDFRVGVDYVSRFNV